MKCVLRVPRVPGGPFAATFAVALVVGLSLAIQTAAAAPETGPADLVTSQDSSTWVDYTIGGDATEEHREPEDLFAIGHVPGDDVGDGRHALHGEFGLHSMGKWIIEIEAPSPTAGEYEATFRISPPQGEYRDDDARTEDRARGTGTITLEDGGKNSMGMAIVKGTFSAAELTADSGFSFTLEGSYSCVMF